MSGQLTRCAVMRDPLAQAVTECTALLKAENLDAWLSLLLAPAAARPALLAAWALLAETARLPWRLREPLLCQMRMEFWRCALLGEETPALPGDMSMPALLALWPPALPRDDMGETLRHVRLLADGAFDNAEAVREWSEAAFTPLWRTLLKAVCISRDGTQLINPPNVRAPGMDAALRALARAYGSGFVLRRAAWPRLSTAAPLLSDEARAQTGMLAQGALSDFEQARRHAWPRRLLPALWPASLMHHWLKKAARRSDFPHKPAPVPSQLVRQWFLLTRRLTGRL